MTASPAPADTDNPTLLDRGDAEAAAGSWPAAIASWEEALTSSDRNRAEARLHWFLSTAGATHRRQLSSRSIVLTGAGAALAGTALVLLAEDLANPSRSGLALLAWILYAMAAGCGVLYASRHRLRKTPPLDEASLERARQLARQMAAASATMPTGSRLPT